MLRKQSEILEIMYENSKREKAEHEEEEKERAPKKMFSVFL